MRVEVVNTVALNGGDAAILLGLRRQLERVLGPEIELVARDTAPGAARALYPEQAFAARAAARIRVPRVKWLGRLVRDLDRLRWRAAARTLAGGPAIARRLLRPGELGLLRAYARADLGISTGGTYFVERYGIWPKVFEVELLQALGTPVVLYTQSLGPFTRRENRRAMRRIAGDAALVLLRDEASRRHLLELGVPPERLHVVADAAFTFALPGRARRPPARIRAVALSVREWPFTANRQGYGDAVAELVVHLVRVHGARVTFLSTCQGVAAYWTDDAREARRIAAALPDDVRGATTVDGEFHRPEALIERLAEFDLAVSTRMHHAILSLCAGTPVLPVAYEFKTRELFARLGLAAFVSDIGELGPGGLVDALERFWSRRAEWVDTLPAAIERERRLADAAAELVAGLPLTPGGRARSAPRRASPAAR
jgi:colanic acid/amylovoran biosynthesis protein